MELKKYKLGEIIETFISGDWGEEEKSSSTPNEVRCIRGADIVPIWNCNYDSIPKRYISNRSFETKRLNIGDIIIEKSGGSPTQSTGRTAFVSKDLIVNTKNLVCTNFCTAFRIKPDWISQYVYYYLQHIYNCGVFFNFEGKTSGLKNLQLDTAFNTLSIKWIPIKKQVIIVNILSSLDRKIALNRRINAKLEQIAKRLYDYWFVQFNFPDKNGKPYKSSGGKMVWNEVLKREVPEGWEVKRICDIAKTYSGGTPKSTEIQYYENGNIPWINSGELNEPIIVEAHNYITEMGLHNSSAKFYPENTILVALYGATAGKVSLLTFKATSNQAVCGVISENKIAFHYLYLFMSSLYDHYVKLSTGSARDNISQDTIKQTLVCVPERNVLLYFDNIISPIFNKITKHQKEISALTALRDRLLPLLMNGQVEVKG